MPTRRTKRPTRRLERLESRQLLSAAPIEGLQHGGGCGCVVCALPAIGKPTDAEVASFAATAPVDSPVFTSSMESVPLYHSLPGASDFLHLDFDGHYQGNWGGFSNVDTPAYDTNGDESVFTTSELNSIYEIWTRVAADFAPFNVNVTTEDLGNYSNRVGLKVAIGGSYNDWYGGPAGGVGYVASYTNGQPNVVYVFVDGTGGGFPKYVAEAASHEAGHGYGLYHQSTYDSQGNKIDEYNPGSGNWAPIMGVGYSKPITTFHNGPNSISASTFQDDVAVLSSANNSYGMRADEGADTFATAIALPISSGSISGTGLTNVHTDVDHYAFTTVGGEVQLTVQGPQYGTNLDIILQLLDSNGQQLLIQQPSSSFNATILSTLSAGDYFLAVKGLPLYGRIGEYKLSGKVNQTMATGGLDAIDPATGVVSGWGLDGDDNTGFVGVDFRIDGVLQQAGIFANQTHATQGSHGYSWQVPAQYQDGVRRTLEVIVYDLQGENAVVVGSRDLLLFPNLVAGDANGDGIVDGADYTVWADHHGLSGNVTAAEGDFNGDGIVNGADFTLWADHFGAAPAPSIPRTTAPPLDTAVDRAIEDLAPRPRLVAPRLAAAHAVDAALATRGDDGSPEFRVARRSATRTVGWERVSPKWRDA